MAHYDFFNFGTSVCSIASQQDKNYSWFKEVVTNYYTTDKDSGSNWQNYYLSNLQDNVLINLRKAIRWTYRGALGSALGFRYNLSNLYDGSKLAVETPILEFLHSKHPEATSLSIQNWAITVNSYAWALNCYLYKYYNSLFSTYRYTDTFSNKTGEIVITFDNPDKTVITLQTERKVLAKQRYYYYVLKKDKWYRDYEDEKYERLFIEYDSVVSFQLNEFRFDYYRNSIKDELVPLNSTVVYVTYSYTTSSTIPVDDIQDNQEVQLNTLDFENDTVSVEETRYGCHIYPCDNTIPLLNQAVVNDARINASTAVIPCPSIPIKKQGSYVGKDMIKLGNKFMKKFCGGNNTFTEIYNSVKKQDSADTSNAFVSMGVSLNNPTQSGKRYLFTFADFIYEKWRDARGYKDSDIQDIWDGTSNRLYRLNGYLTWFDGNNTVAKGIAWTGLRKRTVEGIAATGIKKGEYTLCPVTHGGTPCPYIVRCTRSHGFGPYGEMAEWTTFRRYSGVPGVSFRYQESDHTYVEIIMYGLIMINPVGFFGAGWSPTGALANYANSCVNLGKKLPLGLQLAHWKIYRVDHDDPENSDYMEKVEIDEETGTLLTPKYPPIGDSWYDPFQSVGLLTTLPSMAGSIYSGVQNLYQSVVVNVQLGHNLDYKVDTADSDSGFIIPFDLVNLNRISIVKGCDLVSSSFFVVCEYFKFDRVHYKSWKKWVKVVLQIIVIIIVIIIIVCTYGGGTQPALSGGGAALGWLAGFGALAGIASFMIKALVVAVIVAVAKYIVRKIFGNTFIGMVFQVVLTVVAMYYTGCLDGSALSTIGSTLAVASDAYIDRETERANKLRTEQLQIEYKDTQAKTKYTSQMDLISKKMLAMSNPNSNFNVNTFINGLLLNSSKPCIDGIVPISTWNDTLTSWPSSFYEAYINDPLNMDQYLQLS